MKGFFVTATDTGVGKTIISALLVAHASKYTRHVHYHKPINTGIELESDARTVESLLLQGANIFTAACSLPLRRPLSPHLSAHYQNSRIDFPSLIQDIKKSCIGDINIIEGIGGIMVPITDRHMVLHLIDALKMPTILVARSTLGTINHTLLSLAALKAAGIAPAGVIMVGPPNRDNERSIKYYGQVPLVISIPFLTSINATSIAALSHAKAQELEQLFIQHAS